jgi:uncharacterized protein (TIGR00369 family)
MATRRGVRAQTVAESQVTLHQFMLPEHANPLGNVHGGVIVKLADEAAGICAMRHAHRPCVTVAIDSVAFHSPVHVGELLALTACLSYVGRTSMEVWVNVHAEDPVRGVVTHTNSALLVFVALDEAGKPAPVPPLKLTNAVERARAKGAKERQARRVELAKTLTSRDPDVRRKSAAASASGGRRS